MKDPEHAPKEFITEERTGVGQRGYQMRTATVAVRAYGESLYKAALLNEKILNAMREIQYQEDSICTCELNSSYNYTDPTTKRYRYQSVFDLVYFA